jgi:multiple antibiotic resistance protein
MSTSNLKEILSIFLILFAVIDPLGNIPIIINVKKKVGHISSLKTVIASAVILITFLFCGKAILEIFKIDIKSFSLAGSIVVFILGLEMILNVTIFKIPNDDLSTASIVPLAFPILIGSGTLTTVLNMQQSYSNVNILIGGILNLIISYYILKYTDFLADKLGNIGVELTKKIMGIILLALALQMFKDNIF